MTENKGKNATVTRGGDTLEKANKRVLPNISIRRASIDDLEEIIEIARTFFDYEGHRKEEFNEDVYRITARSFLNLDHLACFAAVHDGVIVGFYAVSWACLHSLRPYMYEVHFAVHPNYVMSSVGRDLTKAVIEFGRSMDVKRFVAGATSGIERFDKSIINMYSKCDMVSSGKMMRYDYG